MTYLQILVTLVVIGITGLISGVLITRQHTRAMSREYTPILRTNILHAVYVARAGEEYKPTMPLGAILHALVNGNLQSEVLGCATCRTNVEQILAELSAAGWVVKNNIGYRKSVTVSKSVLGCAYNYGYAPNFAMLWKGEMPHTTAHNARCKFSPYIKIVDLGL